MSKKYDHRKIIEEYNSGKSLIVLANKYDTYPNQIARVIKRNGGSLRTHSEAQKLNLNNGGKHPTEGKKRSEEEKEKISNSLAGTWQSVSKKDKKDRIKEMQKALKERKKSGGVMEKARQKMKETTEKGSKLEKFVFGKLKKNGYNANYHVKTLINNENMEFDIVVAQNPPVVIEIDGPTHHRDIFGQERLNNQIEADSRKNMLTLSGKMHIIRVYADYTNLPLWKKNKIYNNILEILKRLNGDKDFKLEKVQKVEDFN